MSIRIFETTRFSDNRGFFAETWNKRYLAEMGITVDFVQDNHSLSRVLGTLRGLHFQSPPHAQAKLVRCGRGRLFDVALDIRKKSPTFGHWFGAELSADNGHQMFIPVGYAHGFVTLEPDTEIAYKCSDYYAPASEGAVRWDSCGIEWPLSCDPILSSKDAVAHAFDDFESPFIYGENS